MFEIIGFIVLCLANSLFSIYNWANLWYGGGDLGPLLSGWVHWGFKVWGILMVALNLLFWYIIFLNSPFTVAIK